MMDAVNDPEVHTVVAMTGAQLGKTDGLINNVLGYFIDHDPAPILVVQPTVEMAEAWSKDRFAPMLRDTPALAGKVRDPKSRDAGNTILHKLFPGGHVTAVGANAPAGLASRPIRIVLADEIDRYPASAGTEGDPLALVSKRQTTFWNRKKILTSTPTDEGTSRISAAYQESDRRRYWVPCPHCDTWQLLGWSGVHWPDGQPWAAVYRCDACGIAITDADRWGMVARGKWIAEMPARGVAGFWISGLYSSFARLGDLAIEWVDANHAGENSRERIRAFVNLVLAETYLDKLVGEALDEGFILARAATAEYSYGEAPDAVAAIVAAIDTQNDRLEVSIIGFGPGEESWRIDQATLLGDPNTPAPWLELDAMLARRYTKPDGTDIGILAAVLDTGGGRTQAAYEYAATPTHPCRIFAIKGSNQREAPYIPVDKRGHARFTIVASKTRRRLRLYLLGVSQGKDLLFAFLKQEIPGAGFFHVPRDLSPAYAEQLTAEVKVARRAYGQPVHVWELKSGRRNEAIDQEVYARALIRLLRVDLGKPAVTVDTAPTPSSAPPIAPTPRVAPRRFPARRPFWKR